MGQFWPDFFIVGAARSGTTSLHEYLSRVSGIYMSPFKEPNFFIAEVGPLHSYLPHFNEEEKYLSLFHPRSGEIILGESSVSYLYDSKAPYRIHAKIPDAKILIILRDPIERAYSHFLHDLRYGWETTSDFLQALKNDYYKGGKKGWGFAHLYVELGLYSNQVKRYFDLFGRSKVKIIIYEDEFKPKTRETVQDIVHFLGFKDRVPNDIVQKVFNSSSELDAGSFAVPRFKRVPMMSKLVGNVRKNSLLLMNLTYPITSVIWRNLLTKNTEKPALDEKASQFLLNIYRTDVQELCKILPKTPSWANKYYIQ
jgi:hypothetical protein